MKDYTLDIKDWLEERYKMIDKDGIYIAHQPIYGFRKGHCEPGTISRYIITYQIMKALSHLRFSSLLDVGGSEGYKSALARSIFNINARSADLSAEACVRAKEIFDIDGEPIDIHQLPYKNNEFDVVLCSETLEHVPDLQKATNELLRVCRKAVVITVPHESRAVIEKNIRENIPHAHIHSLDTDSFNFIKPTTFKIITKRYCNPYLKILSKAAEAMKVEKSRNYHWLLLQIYNSCLPLLKFLFCRRSVGMLIRLDDFISNLIPSYSGMIFIIIKDASSWSTSQMKPITPQKVIDFKVPYHYPKS